MNHNAFWFVVAVFIFGKATPDGRRDARMANIIAGDIVVDAAGMGRRGIKWK